ncbi:MAG: hypothetical protein ACLP6G_02835 [Terriglobales bacterium]
MRRLSFGLLLLALTTTGCTKSTNSAAPVSPNTQTSVAQAPVTQAPANNRPRIEIVREAIFSVNSENDDQALSYSEGWKKVLADADAKASGFSSDEMKAQARSEVISTAYKSVQEIRYEEEGRANIKNQKLAYLQQHPDAGFLLGYFANWAAGQLTLGCCEGHRDEPYPPLAAHATDTLGAKVTPEEMDKAFTLIIQDHNAEYQRDEELAYQHAVAEVGSYDHAESAKDAKEYLYKTYIALAVVGDFRSELVDNEGPTSEGLSKHVRKAYLIDASNRSILVELKGWLGNGLDGCHAFERVYLCAADQPGGAAN